MDHAPLLIAGLLLAGCGGPGPDFETRLGAEVWLDGHEGFLTRAQADEMEGWLVARLPEVGYETGRCRACVSRAVVRVVDDGMRCWDDRPCAGEQRDELLLVADTGCAYTSAYLHELAHWLQQCVHGRYDPGHREEPLWRLVRSFPGRCAAAPVLPPSGFRPQAAGFRSNPPSCSSGPR